jgi:hypothetical protein
MLFLSRAWNGAVPSIIREKRSIQLMRAALAAALTTVFGQNALAQADGATRPPPTIQSAPAPIPGGAQPTPGARGGISVDGTGLAIGALQLLLRQRREAEQRRREADAQAAVPAPAPTTPPSAVQVPVSPPPIQTAPAAAQPAAVSPVMPKTGGEAPPTPRPRPPPQRAPAKPPAPDPAPTPPILATPAAPAPAVVVTPQPKAPAAPVVETAKAAPVGLPWPWLAVALAVVAAIALAVRRLVTAAIPVVSARVRPGLATISPPRVLELASPAVSVAVSRPPPNQQLTFRETRP